MWGSSCECRSQPPVHFRQHSITPEAIFPTINTSSSGLGWTIFGESSSDVSVHRLWTSAGPCWVMGQCSADPQTNSLKTPPCSAISHCKNSGFSTNIRHDTESLPRQPLGGAGQSGARFLGVGAICWSLPWAVTYLPHHRTAARLI